MKRTIITAALIMLAIANQSFAHTISQPVSTSLSASPATPLCVAISKGETEVVKKFIEYGADVNESSNGMTPLMVAARYNQVEIIKLLLSNGADASKKDDRGWTAARYAELSHATEAMALLRSKQ